MLSTSFLGPKLIMANDVEMAWMASLGGESGIHVVAGTGSIAYGRNVKGDYARSGGWPEFFGDEGSCYWLGKKTMEIFSKQSDGRLPKGPLHPMMLEHFHLKQDKDFMHTAEELVPHRDKVAALQIILGRAAAAGDCYAAAAYNNAAEELALLVSAIQNDLILNPPFPVSYSGGLFRAGDLILPYFQECIGRLGGDLQPPLLEPMYGGLILAYQTLGYSDINGFIWTLARQTVK